MPDLKGVAFLGFTGIGALVGLTFGTLAGLAGMLLGADFFSVFGVTALAFTLIGAVYGLILEMQG